MWDFLALVSRYGLLCLIAFAPSAMGGIPAWAETATIYGCYAIALVHLPDFVIRRGWTEVPRLPLLLLLAVLLQGWLMAANAKYIYAESMGRLLPLPALLNSWPGTFDREATYHLMNRLNAFAAVFVVMLDLARDPTWRRRALATMGLTGIVLTAFGLSEVAVQWTGLWPQYGHNVWPFATYFYHGNAGAFINLALPLVAAFTARAFFFDTHPWWRGLWALGLAIVIAGAFVNASKAAQAVCVGLLLLCFVPWLRLLRKRLLSRVILLRSLIVLPVFLLTVAGVLYFGDLGPALARWTLAIQQAMLVTGGRLGVAHVCLRIIPQGGLWGFGPGSFTSLFPYATLPEGSSLRGFWRFAHEDYLQTAVEWGWVGAALWGSLVLGGLFSAFFLTLRPRRKVRMRTRLLLWSVGCSLLGCALHAAVDFPLQIPSLSLWFLLLLAVAWSAWAWRREGRPHR